MHPGVGPPSDPLHHLTSNPTGTMSNTHPPCAPPKRALSTTNHDPLNVPPISHHHPCTHYLVNIHVCLNTPIAPCCLVHVPNATHTPTLLVSSSVPRVSHSCCLYVSLTDDVHAGHNIIIEQSFGGPKITEGELHIRTRDPVLQRQMGRHIKGQQHPHQHCQHCPKGKSYFCRPHL
jgi:hypothetical protein